MSITFIRRVGESKIRTVPNYPWRRSKEEWIAEFNTDTVPPTLINGDDGDCEWFKLISYNFFLLPEGAPQFYINSNGEIIRSADRAVIM